MKTETVILFVAGAALLAWLLFSRIAAYRRATPIDPQSSEWRSAIAKAQATLAAARALHDAEPGTVLVKFPIRTKKGTREHAWGELKNLDTATFTVTLESQVIEGEPESPPPYTLPWTSLEDWLKFLPDGSVRGAFTVQAEIAAARAAGKQPSKQARSMEGRFVDA